MLIQLVASIKTGLAALSNTVESGIDPVTPSVQPIGQALMAQSVLVPCRPIQTLVDAIATGIPATLDALAAIMRLGGAGEQQQGQGQGKPGLGFHGADSVGWGQWP
jgi:hypothetical protein